MVGRILLFGLLFMLLECICTMATGIGKNLYKFFLALGLLFLKTILSSEVHPLPVERKIS